MIIKFEFEFANEQLSIIIIIIIIIICTITPIVTDDFSLRNEKRNLFKSTRAEELVLTHEFWLILPKLQIDITMFSAS